MQHVVFLQHGFMANGDSLINFYSELSKLPGITCTLSRVCERFGSTRGIRSCARLLAESVIEYVNANDVRTVSFIGHSMGGLIIRAALEELEDVDVEWGLYATVSTPHLGVKYNPVFSFACRSGYEMCLSDTTLDELQSIPLTRFKHRVLYGNMSGDFVSLESACMTTVENIRRISEYVYRIDDDDDFVKLALRTDSINSHLTITGKHPLFPLMNVKSLDFHIVAADLRYRLGLLTPG
jgi:pimeloyl-ACP methyl ester carboxylesterase